MGNASSSLPHHVIASQDGEENYKWPENLYVETRDMVNASFLVYEFGYILEVARREGGLKGMRVDDSGKVWRSASSHGMPVFTPHQVEDIIKDNSAKLKEHYPSVFSDTTQILKTLELMKKRAEECGLDRPLTLHEYDDKHQTQEMVYAVAKDDVNKRITLVFRGTDNKLAAKTNWTTNLYMAKTGVPVPAYLKDKVAFESLWLHTGFYNYVFDETANESDDPNQRKYDDILNDLKPLLQSNPGYMLYVSGHSLGGALSGLVSFFLACEPDIPKPVTCLNFASPRFGDGNYLLASQVLEQERCLRFCRIVNDNDSIAAVPVINYYHAGFQVRLYKNAEPPPEITYPKIEDSFADKFGRAWGNSLVTSLNFEDDHGDYQERVEQNKEYLEKEDLNELYKDTDRTGWD